MSLSPARLRACVGRPGPTPRRYRPGSRRDGAGRRGLACRRSPPVCMAVRRARLNHRLRSGGRVPQPLAVPNDRFGQQG